MACTALDWTNELGRWLKPFLDRLGHKTRRRMCPGEHRMSGDKKYYLSNLPAKTNLRTLAATIKARWICEQAHQQMKEELGLDHFEGRSWHGLHRHVLMTMIAYAFLQHRRLKIVKREKKNQRTAASTNPAGRALRHPRTHRSATTATLPALSKTDLHGAAA